jgi:hypothetical protein
MAPTIGMELAYRYEHALAYSDEGAATVSRGREVPEFQVEFATHFTRAPVKLEVHLTMRTEFFANERTTLRWDGSEVVVESTNGTILRPASLASAIARLTGVSAGAAHVVPRLLLPSLVGGRACCEGALGTSQGDLMLDDRRYNVIEVGDAYQTRHLYIDAEFGTLRRLEVKFSPGAEVLVAADAKKRGIEYGLPTQTSAVMDFFRVKLESSEST